MSKIQHREDVEHADRAFSYLTALLAFLWLFLTLFCSLSGFFLFDESLPEKNSILSTGAFFFCMFVIGWLICLFFAGKRICSLYKICLGRTGFLQKHRYGIATMLFGVLLIILEQKSLNGAFFLALFWGVLIGVAPWPFLTSLTV